MDKATLDSYRKLKAEERQIRGILDKLEAGVYSPGSQVMSGVPSAHRVEGGSRQERAADRTMELRAVYEEKLRKLIDRCLAIEAAIDRVSPSYRVLLRYRYIEGLPWNEVAKAMGYSLSNIHKLHIEALRLIR